MSIEKKGNKYLARWEAVHPEDRTKRHRVSKSFDTRREAEMHLCNVAPKAHQWDLNRPLEEAMVAWIKYRRGTDAINAKTADRQLNIAANFGLTIPGKAVARVTTEDIQAALTAMKAGRHRPGADGERGRPLKPRTRHQHLVVLAQFYAAKLAGGHLRVDPVAPIKLPRMPIEDPNEPDAKHVTALIGRLASKTAANGNLPLLVTLIEITGLRRGEALALMRDDFDAALGIVRITKSLLQTKKDGLEVKPPKSDKGKRLVEVPAWFFPLLQAHYSRLDAQKTLHGDAYLARGLVFPDAFGEYLKPDTVSGQIAEAKRAAGWPEGVHGLHGLRHKFGSHLAHSGQVSIKDIAHALGHADEAFTLRTYVKRQPKAPRTAHLFSPTGAG
jgi:integrase